jgi:hypothetical protein
MVGSFKLGDRVQILETYHWARSAFGIVQQPPLSVVELVKNQDPWKDGQRLVHTRLGLLTFYWVELDVPQMDADGEGPYNAAEVDSRYLAHVVVQ